MTGLGFWVPVYPIDTVKSNVQAIIFDKQVSFRRNGTMIREIRKIYKSNGLKAYMIGITAILGRAFFSNAIGFWMWEYSKTVFTLDK